MRWALFLLTLTGQCLVSTCHLYSYTFINVNMTWNEAQMYCRTHHTDLAILFNGTDEERLRQSAVTLNGSEGWIGLYHLQPAPKQWHWSLPEETFNDTDTRWYTGQPDDNGGQENCVIIDSEGKWADINCNSPNIHGFICCDGNQTCEIVLGTKNWRDAQIDCRGRNKDLISGIKQLEESTPTLSDYQGWWLWIGLFRDQWQWSNGNSSNFRNWESDQDNTEGEKCAWIELRGSKKWKSADCTERKTFFCYDGAVVQSDGGAGLGQQSTTEHTPLPGEGLTVVQSDGGAGLGQQSTTEHTPLPGDDGMILIREKKTWEDALDYCRENHRDLASVTDARQQRLIEVRAKMADTDHVWLGLRWTTRHLWFWVNGEDFSYNRLHSDSEEKSRSCYAAVAMETGGEHMWFQIHDDEKLNFICIK